MEGALTLNPRMRAFSLEAQHVGVVYAVAAGEGRAEEGQQLVGAVWIGGGTAQIEPLVGQFPDSQVLQQQARRQQPGVGDQRIVVEKGFETLGAVLECFT